MTTVKPFNEMDMWEQNWHMGEIHKVDIGPPMLDGMAKRHTRRHEMDLDLDHTHGESLPPVRVADPQRLLDLQAEEHS